MAAPKAKAKGKIPRGFTPPDYTLAKGETPDSARVVYIPGKGLVPHIPYDPDLDGPVTANGWLPIGGKLANGLTPRMDAFARLVARGVSGSDAMRATWPTMQGRNAGVIASRAGRVMDRTRMTVSGYRLAWEERGQQKSIPVRDFVLSRLTLEAQDAPESASRIKALDLLGKSEAMWTTTVRQEHTVSPTQLAGLKTQLEQRLSMALSKLGAHRITAIMENRGAARSALGTGPEVPPETPPEGHPPLHGSESRDPGDTNPPIYSPDLVWGGSFSGDGAVLGVGLPDLEVPEAEYIGPPLPDYLLKKP